MDPFESINAPTSTLNRFHETSAKFQRYKVLLRRRWWFLLLTVAIAICYEALAITGKATQYIALGKIVANIHVNADGQSCSGNAIIDSELQRENFFGTQIEILESGALKHQALERVRGLHPELKEVEVAISVTQTKGSSILKVAAIGDEQKYTRVYLDALLDEYMAFRQEMVEKSVGNAMNKVIDEVLSRDQAVNVAKTTYDTYLKENDLSHFEGNHNEAAVYMKQLENTRDRYETELRLMDKLGQKDYLQAKEQGPQERAAGRPVRRFPMRGWCRLRESVGKT